MTTLQQPGRVTVAGLGPGNDALITPEVTAALAEATDIVGYIPYVARIAPRTGLTLHPSDNRVELDRAQTALDMAAEGRQVVIVSSGDPGVFAMASALFEALETRPDRADTDIRILPGITAMLAAIAPPPARVRPWATISAPSTCPTTSNPLPRWNVACATPPKAALPWRSITPVRNPARTSSPACWKSCARNANPPA